MLTLTPVISNTPASPPSYNSNIAETFSWIPIENNANRPLYARASYITNLSDLSISLSAQSLNIGAVAIKDGNSDSLADVEAIGGGLNALRVLTQALSPNSDTVSLADINSNNVTVEPSTSSLNVNVTNNVPLSVSISTLPTVFVNNLNLDSFGRLRTSNPFTLFDSSHRYQDNDLWSTKITSGGTTSFSSNQGLVLMSTNTSSGSEVIRETTKTFAYQPGKSLLVINTFVMAPMSSNLRQRVGYFGEKNGCFLELNGTVLSFVKRTSVNGTITEFKQNQDQWNIDSLDGTGPSKLVLNIDKAQILWMDFEWLGAGTVRLGFVIDGQFVHCHSFHHANIIDSTYITTACLPIRYEITNTSITSLSNTLKQICSTVISEGGYELRGEQTSVSTPITSPTTLGNAGIFSPVISLRLKSVPDRLDAIAIISAVSILGTGNGKYFKWALTSRSTTTGGTWLTTSPNSSVEYKLNGASVSGGKILASGFFNSSNQSATVINIPKEELFKFQLERDSINLTSYEITLQITSATNSEQVFASMDWEEITR